MIQVSRRRAMLGLASGLALGPLWVTAANASGPPLWVAERRTSKVYFFGQMPVPTNSVWLSSAVQQAFDSSSELWTENPDPRASDFKPAPSTGAKLSEVATPAEMARLRSLLVREGLAATALDATLLADAYPVVSWLQDHAIEADFNVFPERVLRTKAKAAGKTVHSEWASFEEVVRFRDALGAAQRQQLDLELFRRGLDEAERITEARQRLTEWMAGDLNALNAMAERNRRYPLIEKVIGADRNKAWVARTSSIMRRTPAAFVCVGIGHLLGPSSILKFLQQDGMQVRRI